MTVNRIWLLGGTLLFAVASLVVVLLSRPPREAPPATGPPAARAPLEQPPAIDPAAPASPLPDSAARGPAYVPDETAAGVLFDTAGEPTREFVLASLRAAIERKLPGQKLSSEEYDQLADAVLRMRSVQHQLRGVPPTAENAERLRALREELAAAAGDFEYVLEMSPAEFTAQVQRDAGIDEADSDEAGADDADAESTEPEYLEDLRRD